MYPVMRSESTARGLARFARASGSGSNRCRANAIHFDLTVVAI